MSSNWPGQTVVKLCGNLAPGGPRQPRHLPWGRMAGYDGDPGTVPPRRSSHPLGDRSSHLHLGGINCAVYLAMVMRGVSPPTLASRTWSYWGANFGGYVLAGQWWRVLTAAFVHVGILHLATKCGAYGIWGCWVSRCSVPPAWSQCMCSREWQETYSALRFTHRWSAQVPRVRFSAWPASLSCC